MATQTKKIVIDTAALLVGRAVGLLLGVVRLNFLASYLGLANFGILSFAAYFTALFQTLFDLGVSQLLTRELARDEAHSNRLLGAALTLKAVTVLIATLCIVGVMLLSGFDHATNGAVLLTTAALALNGFSTTLLSAFQARRKMVLVSGVSIVNDILTSILIIVAIPSMPVVTTPLTIIALVAAMNAGALFILYRREAGSLDLHADLATWRMLLGEALPLAVTSLAISLYTFIGPTVLQYTRGKAEVGIYSAAYKLISILTLIPASLTQVLYPIFSEFHARAQSKTNKSLWDAVRVMAEISVPVCIGTVLLAPAIIGFLYPAAFADASLILQIIVAGSAIGYVGWVFHTFVIATNRQRFAMWNSVGAALFVVVCSAVAIPRFGPVAVAVIVMSTDALIFLSLLVYVVRSCGMPGTPETYAKILAAGAVFGLVLLVLRDLSPVLAAILAVPAYLAALFALRVPGDQEREVVHKLFRR